jgi:catechol 2,3-dioxygenase-like lactoylglutathione lyase family enzyme
LPLRFLKFLCVFLAEATTTGVNQAFKKRKEVFMKRMHVMLGVKNLDESVKFYSALFDSAPTVSKSDYAKWMLEDPRVNFSIAEKAGAHGIEHLGIQAESAAELEQLRARIARAGGVVRNEGETTCCYANSDKTWVVDGQGVAWEGFYTSGVAKSYYGEGSLGCCQASAAG